MKENKIIEIIRYIRSCASFSGYSFHKNENFSPFFIVGSGRSGNTLLRRILNEHSNIFIPPEIYAIEEVIKVHQKYKNLEWKDFVKLVLSLYQFDAVYYTFKIGNLEKVYHQLYKLPKEKQSLAIIINAIYNFYKEEHNIKANIWGDKTPLNTFYMQEIHSIFPNTKFIHIIRNPYDVVYSYINAGIYTDYEEAARRWKMSIEKASEFGEQYPDNYHEIEYEKLVDDPKHEIEKICKFLEITFEDTMLQISETSQNLGDVQKLKHHSNVLQPISKNNIGKGIKSLTSNEKRLIEDVLVQSKNSKARSYMN